MTTTNNGKADFKRQQTIRALNDAFRHSLSGGALIITAGIAALSPDLQQKIVNVVRAFDKFDADNDPWDEHDFGSFELDGERVFFKFDYYDLQRAMHSPNPADPAVTERVLTIMLAEEY